ncbi:MAG: hypothetical protein AAF411_04565 [Myxococcota bacterium]
MPTLSAHPTIEPFFARARRAELMRGALWAAIFVLVGIATAINSSLTVVRLGRVPEGDAIAFGFAAVCVLVGVVVFARTRKKGAMTVERHVFDRDLVWAYFGKGSEGLTLVGWSSRGQQAILVISASHQQDPAEAAAIQQLIQQHHPRVHFGYSRSLQQTYLAGPDTFLERIRHSNPRSS